MLNNNYTQFIGRPLIESEDDIRNDFFGAVVVVHPGEVVTTEIRPSRLQVHVDDQGLISRIIHG